MSRGQPDYGLYAVKEVTASISDMGEVAARLGSIVTYDKRGDVVDFDNFEQPVLSWGGYDPDAASYTRLDIANPYTGSQSVKLHSDDGADEDSFIDKYSSVLVSRRLGHEISFSLLHANLYFYLWLLEFTGELRVEGEVKIDGNTGELSILTARDTYTLIDTIGTIPRLAFSYITVKIVLDFSTKKYVRLLVGAREYDVSAYSLTERAAPLNLPQIGRGAWVLNKAAAGGDCWLDSDIFTQAEP